MKPNNPKTGKFFAIAVAAVFLGIIVFSWLHASIPKWAAQRNLDAVKALFEDKALTESDAEPVVKRPFALYGQENERLLFDWNWDYRAHVSGTALLDDAGLTDQIKDARTCIYVWTDIQGAEKSKVYEWVDSKGISHADAWFCPVYMTVIDREDGVRYADIQLGSVPMAEHSKYGGRYHGDLYNSEKAWSTFDLDGWLAAHWEA